MSRNSDFMIIISMGLVLLAFIFAIFYMKKVPKLQADSDSYSYVTEVIIEDKKIENHTVIVNKMPIVSTSYVAIVSLPNENETDVQKRVIVGSSVYDTLNIGDSVLATINVNEDSDELLSITLGTP